MPPVPNARSKGIRIQKKYCDFRCWNATGVFCSCWCGGGNHGKGCPPPGFDPKRGLTEDEYQAMVTRDHPPTFSELRKVAFDGVQPGPHVLPYPDPGLGFKRRGKRTGIQS